MHLVSRSHLFVCVCVLWNPLCSFGKNEMNLTRSSKKISGRNCGGKISFSVPLEGICFHLPSFRIHSARSRTPCQDPNYPIPLELLTHTIMTNADYRQTQFSTSHLEFENSVSSVACRRTLLDLVGFPVWRILKSLELYDFCFVPLKQSGFIVQFYFNTDVYESMHVIFVNYKNRKRLR